MKFAIIFTIVAIIYRQLSNLFKFIRGNQLISRIICGIVFISILMTIYNFIANYRNTRRGAVNIDFSPVTITIFRIPIEDRIDFEVEDDHNVHNKTIKRTAIKAIEELKKVDLGKYSIQSAFDSIYKYINSQPQSLSSQKLELASETLAQIDEIDSFYQTAQILEKEVTRLVWERIHHSDNFDKLEQLKENLIVELADCNKGDGSLHCCEGRITRMLQSLQSCDNGNIVDLRPMWAFKEEIENKISRYREKLHKKLPKTYSELDMKKKLTDHDKKLMDRFNQCLIKNLGERFNRDYIKPGFLTKSELNDITEAYYQSLYDY